MGTAGDFSGTQQVAIAEEEPKELETRLSSSRREDLMAESISTLGTSPREEKQSQKDQRTVREALRFFFSPDGGVFREFILEEIVSFVDNSGREASQEVMMALGLNNLPMPSLIRALSPELSSNDKQNVRDFAALVGVRLTEKSVSRGL